MSATNTTTNYSLPLFIGTDKPAWLVDWNSAMSAIDAAIKAVDTDVQGAIVDISGLSSTVAAHTSSISTISGQITVITTNLNTATGNINTINSLIGNGTPTTTDQTLIGAINELHADQGDLDNLLTTTKASLVAAINEIVEGSGGASVKATAAANDTYADQLTSLANAFNGLTDVEKARSFILGSNGTIYVCTNATYGIFILNSINATNGTPSEIALVISNSKAFQITSGTSSEISTSTDGASLTLYA